MTREEAKELTFSKVDRQYFYSSELCKKVDITIDKIYDDFEHQLKTAQYNLDAQEIIIADYKKRIEELEEPKSCESCHYCKDNYYGYKECTAISIKYICTMDMNGFYCSRYKPKDKQ